MTCFYSPSGQGWKGEWPKKPVKPSAPVCNPYVVLFLVSWFVFGVFWTMHRKAENPGPPPSAVSETQLTQAEATIQQ